MADPRNPAADAAEMFNRINMANIGREATGHDVAGSQGAAEHHGGGGSGSGKSLFAVEGLIAHAMDNLHNTKPINGPHNSLVPVGIEGISAISGMDGDMSSGLSLEGVGIDNVATPRNQTLMGSKGGKGH